MLYVLAVIIGFFLGCVSTIYFKYQKAKSSNPKYIRRGIYDHKLELSSAVDKNKIIYVQFEVGELESTKNRSKIEVLSVSPGESQYNTLEWKKKMKDLISNTWIDSPKIDWIEKSLSEERNKKIEEILGGKQL
jgi:hypothetical protein